MRRAAGQIMERGCGRSWGVRDRRHIILLPISAFDRYRPWQKHIRQSQNGGCHRGLSAVARACGQFAPPGAPIVAAQQIVMFVFIAHFRAFGGSSCAITAPNIAKMNQFETQLSRRFVRRFAT
jgi:hypothetical protein